jgi:hypothetical protein
MKQFFSQVVFAGLVAVTGAAQAVTVSPSAIGLFNTGVDASGTPLADNAIDTHYTLAAGPAYAAAAGNGYPIPPNGPWLGADLASSWITPSLTTVGPQGATYTYTTTFDITGYIASSASLTGRFAVDNNLTSVSLNGTNLGITGRGVGYWTSFAINSGFVTGVNTLQFAVVNGGTSPNPTGLRVEFSQFTAAVPEPESYALALVGLLTVGGMLRIRRA